MSIEVTDLNHKNKSIIKIAFNGKTTDEQIQDTKDYGEVVLKHKDETILVILDFSNTSMNRKAAKVAEKIEKEEKLQGITKVTAIVGVSGLQKMIIQTVKRDVHFCSNEEEALEWLVANSPDRINTDMLA